MKELFHTQCEHNVIHPGRDVEPGQMKGGGRTGTRVFRVNDRDAADTEFAQHDLTPDTLLSGNQTGHRIPHGRGLNILRSDPCRLYGAFNRLTGQILHTAIHMFAKARHPRSNECNLSHTVPLSCRCEGS